MRARLPIRKISTIAIVACLVGVELFVSSPVRAITLEGLQSMSSNSEFYWKGQPKACGSTGTGGEPGSGNDNPAIAYNYFIDKGLTNQQSAAIVGNFWEESKGVNPAINQDGGGKGRGIAQWSVDGRWLGVLEMSRNSNPHREPTDLLLQLDFAWKELNGSYKNALDKLRAEPSKTVDNRVVIIRQFYEQAGVPHDDVRIADAVKLLKPPYSKSDLTQSGAATTGPIPGGATSTGGQTTGGSNTSANTGSCSSSAGVVNGSIVKTAIGLAWPDNNKSHASQPTDAYRAAWNKASNYTDCGAFVATVMVKSGADPNYPPVGTGIQKSYVESHPEKYQKVDFNNLQPGDILVENQGSIGHTMIFVGPQPGGYVVADASLGDHTPQLNTSGDLTWMEKQPGVIAVRLINQNGVSGQAQ